MLADCGTIEDARQAVDLGADALASTFGFLTNEIGVEPDFLLLEQMIKLGLPVFAEGVLVSEQVVKAFEMGAWALVVGGAVTRPEITKRFVRALKRAGVTK